MSSQALPDWITNSAPAQPLAPDATRDSARAGLNETGLPGLRDEEWRWTNLRPINRGTFNLAAQSGQAANAEHDLALEDAIVIPIIDGVAQTLPTDLPQGLTISRLSQADNTAQQAAFATHASADNPNDALVNLNTMLAAEGLVIDVAANAQIDAPILLQWLDGQQSQTMSHPRILVRVGASAQATVIDQIEAPQDSACWRNGVLVGQVAQNAELRHITLALSGNKRISTDRCFVQVERDGRYRSFNVQLQGQLSRREYDIDILGSDAHCDLIGLMMPRGKSVFDTHTRIHHAVADTTSNEQYRTIADDAGRGIFKGRILVARDAQRTDAFQASDSLILSDQAEIDAKPELEIYADDVKCSHGATIGELDQEALFYLQSRGIPEQQARGLLVSGFAQEIIDQIPEPRIVDWLTHHIANYLIEQGAA